MPKIIDQIPIRNQIDSLIMRPGLALELDLASYILLLKSARVLDSNLSKQLYFHFHHIASNSLEQKQIHPFHLLQGSALMHSQNPDDVSSSHIKELIEVNRQIQAMLDPQYSGIIKIPESSQASIISSLTAQSFWVQNIQDLYEIASSFQQNGSELSLELEILIHETNATLWDQHKGVYKTKHENDAQCDKLLSYLPMWALIPDLDQAEQLLLQLRAAAPPWNELSDQWYSAESVLLYEGLKAYEMHKAAGELKDYLLQNDNTKQDSWLTACIALFFDSPMS